MTRALVTGITGQDGSYMAEFLLEKGYEVHGLVRRSSLAKFDRVEHIKDRLKFVDADVTDQSSMDDAIDAVQPEEVYHFAAQSFVPTSWRQPILTAQVNALGVTRLLDAIRKHKPDARVYQASSSEMFGKVREVPQTEATPFYPRSPYAVSKVFAHHLTVNYRESYGIFACCGICFNHESPRRGLKFVTRKVSHGVASIKLGLQHELRMGNLEARRDWGYTPEYIEAMWLMLQQPEPDDYVIATGKSYSVRELLETAFDYVGLSWEQYAVTDEAFCRPVDVDLLVGDASKAREKLGWVSKTDFRSLVELMVDSDLERLSKRSSLPRAGAE